MIKCEQCGNTDLQSTDQFNETTKKLELFIVCIPCQDMSVVDTDISADPYYLDEVRGLPDVENEKEPFGNPADFLD